MRILRRVRRVHPNPALLTHHLRQTAKACQRRHVWPPTKEVATEVSHFEYGGEGRTVACRADKGWAMTTRALRSSREVWCGVGLVRALFLRLRCVSSQLNVSIPPHFSNSSGSGKTRNIFTVFLLV